MDIEITGIGKSQVLSFLVFSIFITICAHSLIYETNANPIYTLTLDSYETSGSSSNLGLIFIDGVQYSLPSTVYLSEGQHSVFYYPPDEHIFSRWETSGFITLDTVTTNGNIIQLNGSSSITARYSQGPQLYIQILNPVDNVQIDDDVAQIIIRITAENFPVQDALATLYINDTIIGTSLSDLGGIIQIEYPIEPFEKYIFRASVQKGGYKTGQSSLLTLKKQDVYRYILNPENGEINTDKTFFLKAQFFINDVPTGDVDVSIFLDDEYIGRKKTTYNGYISFEFHDIEPGNHSWYVIFERHNSFSVISDEIDFSYYGNVVVTALDTLREDVDYINMQNIRLNTKVFSNNHPIPLMKVIYYVNNVTIGYNYTDVNGYSSFSFQYENSNETIIWFSSIMVQSSIISNSSKRIFIPFIYMPSIEINVLSPISGYIFKNYSPEIHLKCISYIDNLTYENVLINYYVNNKYIGYNHTDKYGKSSYIYKPPYDGSWYNWHITGSKKNCINYTSNPLSFYYPKSPTNISVINTILPMNRVDINSTQHIGYQLQWTNGPYLSNVDLIINDNIRGRTNNSGWVIIPVSDSSVGAVTYHITDILSEGIGHILCEEYPTIIWDQVVFDISSNKSRYDVGLYVTPSVVAWYAYDEMPFIGTYFFNTELFSSVIGEKEVYINRIIDDYHNLSAVKCNKIKIVWDIISFKVLSSETRYQLDSSFMPSLLGKYEYDKSEFIGSYSLDLDSQPNYVGIYKLSKLNIIDHKYQLTNYTIEDFNIIYDEIIIEDNIITKYPGSYIISIKPFFSYDNKIVDAIIIINNNRLKYDKEKGEYNMVIKSWNFIYKYNMQLEHVNFYGKNSIVTIFHIINLYCIIGFSMFPISIAFLYYNLQSMKNT